MLAEKKWLVFLTVISVFVFMGIFKVRSYIQSERRDYTEISAVKVYDKTNKQVPVLSAVDKTDLGAVFVLWASWCEPCLKELPDLAKHRVEFGQRNIKVILVNYDQDEFKKLHLKTSAYLKQIEADDFVSYYDEKRALLEVLDLQSLPAMLMVSPRGQVLKVYRGLIDWNDAEFRDKIQRHFLDSRRASFHHHFGEKSVT